MNSQLCNVNVRNLYLRIRVDYEITNTQRVDTVILIFEDKHSTYLSRENRQLSLKFYVKVDS